MKKRKKGGEIALFIFLIVFLIFGGILLSFPKTKPPKQNDETFSEEYDPEEVRTDKILVNGKTYFSFVGVYEKYSDFVEEELEKEGIIFSEIESPEDYEDILTPDDFEKISQVAEILEENEGTWIEAEERELLDFIENDFPEFKKEEIRGFFKNLITNAKILEEEIDEYTSLDEIKLKFS